MAIGSTQAPGQRALRPDVAHFRAELERFAQSGTAVALGVIEAPVSERGAYLTRVSVPPRLAWRHPLADVRSARARDGVVRRVTLRSHRSDASIARATEGSLARVLGRLGCTLPPRRAPVFISDRRLAGLDAWAAHVIELAKPDERFEWDDHLERHGDGVGGEQARYCLLFADAALTSISVLDQLLESDRQPPPSGPEQEGLVVLDVSDGGQGITANGSELVYGPATLRRGGRITTRHSGIRLLYAVYRSKRRMAVRSDSVSDLNAALVRAGAGQLRLVNRLGTYEITGAVSFTEALLRRLGERIPPRT